MSKHNFSLEQTLSILVQALNHMDIRLTGHSERVAYSMYLLLIDSGTFSPDEIYGITITSLFHDIGNLIYDTAQTFALRETDNSFSHALYGSLFLEEFSPFPQYAPLVRYHHSSAGDIDASGMERRLCWAAKCLQVVDSADLHRIYHPVASAEQAIDHLNLMNSRKFDIQAIEAVKLLAECQLPKNRPIVQESVRQRLIFGLKSLQISNTMQRCLLEMLIHSIDFRSHYTALHCAIVVEISQLLARLCGLSEDDTLAVYYGAMFHDIGKIAIPKEILESPKKLHGTDWELMQSHVLLTEEILRGKVCDEILQIAIRHHETLDGKGYPYKLSASELTLPQRIVAVADIVSALSEERSYKAAFSMDEILRILDDLREKGKICPVVVDVIHKNESLVYQTAKTVCLETAAKYEKIYNSYYAAMPS